MKPPSLPPYHGEEIIDAEFEEIEPAPQPPIAPHYSQPIQPKGSCLKRTLQIGGALIAGIFVIVVLASDPKDNGGQNVSANQSPTSDAAPSASEKHSRLRRNDVVKEGYCQMGTCSWAAIRSKTLLRAKRGQRLIRLELIGGSSPDTGSPAGDRDKITWDSRPHPVYAFCARNLPTLMMRSNGKWQVDVLDFVNGFPALLNDSADLYTYACHGAGTAWTEPDFAQNHGYQSPATDTLFISKPEDLFVIDKFENAADR